MEQDTASKKTAWDLPLLGMITMFSLAVLAAVGVKRSQSSTRQINVGFPQTDASDEMPFLSDDGPVE